MMVYAVASLAGIGLVIGAVLAYAAKIFAVEVDPRTEAITGVLPSANCGACGFAGCAALAGAIVSGEAPVNGCVVGGAPVAAKIADIMGVKASGADARNKARVICQGGKDVAAQNYEYKGVKDCKAAALLNGGPKTCEYGCIGLGSCAAACPFDAIRMNEAGLPEIDEVICTGCGVCVRTCPKTVIELVPMGSKVQVRCSSNDKGAAVRKICQVGCIGCGICAKTCPVGAITVTDNLAQIDYAKCTSCGLCATKCPTKAIAVENTEAGQKVTVA